MKPCNPRKPFKGHKDGSVRFLANGFRIGLKPGYRSAETVLELVFRRAVNGGNMPIAVTLEVGAKQVAMIADRPEALTVIHHIQPGHAAKARAMRQRMRMVARQASLDPNDGIEL